MAATISVCLFIILWLDRFRFVVTESSYGENARRLAAFRQAQLKMNAVPVQKSQMGINIPKTVIRANVDRVKSMQKLTRPVRRHDSAKDFASIFNYVKRSASSSSSLSSAYLFPRSDRGGNLLSHHWVPFDRILIVELGVPVTTVRLSKFLPSLKLTLSRLLPVPIQAISIYNIHFRMNAVEVVFNNPSARMTTLQNSDLLPISDVIYPNLLLDLQQQFPTLNITGAYPASRLLQMNSATAATLFPTKEPPMWLQPHFAYIISASVILILFAVGITMYCCLRVRLRGYKLANLTLATTAVDSPSSEASKKHGSLSVGQKQICIYPGLAPATSLPSPVQPEPDLIPSAFSSPSHVARFKGKGLLERRGSNASLTIDVTSSPELTRWEGTPPKESSALEYLQSAGNRLSRYNLQQTVHCISDLYEEFWEIPSNMPEKVFVAGSGTKNRYKSVIPHDHSRVILSCTDDADPFSVYINANYIRGYEGEPRAYIATQGPMSHTIVDFWLMVWQEAVSIIVMITKLCENNKVKCENYLPETNGVYGDMVVTVDNVDSRPGYTVRHITLQHGTDSRSLVHFWYTDWPDHKPPDCARSLLDMIEDVDSHRDHLTVNYAHHPPTLLHCSAGIGRSGCYIAINIGMQQLREERSVDIMGLVCSMRIDRGGMVQTSDQYVFVHQALSLYDREYLHDDPTLSDTDG